MFVEAIKELVKENDNIKKEFKNTQIINSQIIAELQNEINDIKALIKSKTDKRDSN